MSVIKIALELYLSAIFIDKRFAQVEQIEINVATNDTGERRYTFYNRGRVIMTCLTLNQSRVEVVVPI